MDKRRVTIITLGILGLLAALVLNKWETKTVVAEARIVNGGDLLISGNIIEGAKTEEGTYDFNDIFRYVKKYVEAADYAVINLETSIAGEAVEYGGFPRFNTPASIVTAAKNAGFDMFLTASNHSYDLGYDALINRIDVLRQENVEFIGTRENSSQSFHKVIEVNGIKIGMLNYTKEYATSTKEQVILNSTRSGENGEREYVIVDNRGQELISSYNENHLDEFYGILEKDIQDLWEQGAEIIAAYPHWGREYNIGYDEMETQIAQKMCDLGVDIIIGGHPHVVEPVKVYTSEKSGKTTVCIYSTGNFVSSMRASTDRVNAEYTEDGVLFEYTVSKYSDGTVAVTEVEALPLWVKKTEGSKYTVIPLDPDVSWREEYGIGDYSEYKSGYKSYNRTRDLVNEGIELYNRNR